VTDSPRREHRAHACCGWCLATPVHATVRTDRGLL